MSGKLLLEINSFQGNKILNSLKNLTLDTNETLDSNSDIYDDDGSGLAESLVLIHRIDSIQWSMLYGVYYIQYIIYCI